MTRFPFSTLVSAVLALALTLTLTSCDSGPGEPPEPENQAPTARLSVSSTAVEAGESVSFDGSSSTDADGTIGSYVWNFGDGTDGSGKTTTHSYEAVGEYDVTLTVTDNEGATDDADVSITVAMADPESVSFTLSRRATDGDSLVAGDFSLDGETIATDVTEVTRAVDFADDAVEVCTSEAEFFLAASCVTRVPNEDREVRFELERKSIELDVSVEPEDAEVVVTDRDGREDVQDGSFTADYRKLSGDRVIDVAADGYESETETVAADADHALAFDLVEIPPQPACSDGDDNDGDGLVDAEDFGCLSPDGVYEPEDDDEGHRVRTSTIFGYQGTVLVSETDPELLLAGTRQFHESILIAGNILVQSESKIDTSESGEAYALSIHTGESPENLDLINITELIPDNPSENDWRVVEIDEVDRLWFENGPFIKIIALHQKAVNGNGGGDVILGEGFDHGFTSFSWAYDPDNLPSGGNGTSQASPQSLTRPLEVGACQKTAFGEVCRDVVPDWYLPRR